MKRAGIIAKKSLKGAKGVFKSLNMWLIEKGLEVYFDENTASTLGIPVKALKWEEFSKNVDWVIVLGGDGTFLRAVRYIYGTKIPILGVNFGSLGFLTEVPLEDVFFNLDSIVKGDFKAEERSLLKTSVYREGKLTTEYHALNEIVITKGALSRIIELEVTIDNLLINRFRSDGLIISTPTGSTAYSLSAGGPILFPTLGALAITPICPHTLTNRPIVIPDSGTIKINIKSKNESVYLTVDGQIGLKIQEDDIVEAAKAPHCIYMIKPQDKSYYEILRTKLYWGQM